MEIEIVKNILEESEKLADEVRLYLKTNNQIMLNFMGSPGAGKTSVLNRLIRELKKESFNIAVIEGDISTTLDSERLKPLNIPIVQINTERFGGDCHLAPNTILPALRKLPVESKVILLENVGNLVCPAEFDTGANLNIVVYSVTEGVDKPFKYPLMFRKCQFALIHKVDLAKAVEVNPLEMRENILKINPEIKIIETSAKTGAGISELVKSAINSYFKS